MQPRFSEKLYASSEWAAIDAPYIGFHARLSDNIENTQRDFGLNMTEIVTFSNFMREAQKIRQMDSRIRTIFIACDHAEFLKQTEDERWAKEVSVATGRAQINQWLSCPYRIGSLCSIRAPAGCNTETRDTSGLTTRSHSQPVLTWLTK